MKLSIIKAFVLARLKAFVAAPTPALIVGLLKLVGVDITADQAVAIIGLITPLLVHFVPNIAPTPATPAAPKS